MMVAFRAPKWKERDPFCGVRGSGTLCSRRPARMFGILSQVDEGMLMVFVGYLTMGVSSVLEVV